MNKQAFLEGYLRKTSAEPSTASAAKPVVTATAIKPLPVVPKTKPAPVVAKPMTPVVKPVAQTHKIFSPDVVDYIQKEFQPQADNFKKFGRNPKLAGYHPKFDYGGTGTAGDTPQKQALYRKMADQLGSHIYNNEVKKNPEAFAKRWHGGTAAANAAYWAKVQKAMNAAEQDPYKRTWQAIRAVETGGQKNPWIRTRGSPGVSSTAYGEHQITSNMVGDYFKRYGNPSR